MFASVHLPLRLWFERGYRAVDTDEKLRCYTEAIYRDPDLAEAYYNRGVARHAKGDLDAALLDYNEAMRLKPDDAVAYFNRGAVRQEKGDLNGAIARLQRGHTPQALMMPIPTITVAWRVEPKVTSTVRCSITTRAYASSPTRPWATPIVEQCAELKVI